MNSNIKINSQSAYKYGSVIILKTLNFTVSNTVAANSNLIRLNYKTFGSASKGYWYSNGSFTTSSAISFSVKVHGHRGKCFRGA